MTAEEMARRSVTTAMDKDWHADREKHCTPPDDEGAPRTP
jgi:hypothetical protein